MAITAIGSAQTWVTPLQIAHKAISMPSASQGPSIKSWITHVTLFSSSPGLNTNGHALCHRPLAGMYRYYR